MTNENANADPELELFMRKNGPKAAMVDMAIDSHIETAHFSRSAGFEDVSFPDRGKYDGEFKTLHEILLDLGYEVYEDLSLPGDECSQESACAIYAKFKTDRYNGYVFVRNCETIFVDSFADLLVLKTQLAPLLLLVHLNARIDELTEAWQDVKKRFIGGNRDDDGLV